VNLYLSKIINCNFNQANDSQPESGNYLNIDRSQINDSRINMPVSTVNINKSNFLYSTAYPYSYCVISGNGTIDSSSFTGNGGLTAIERGPVGSGYPYDNNNLYKFTNCTFIAFGTDIKINASTNSTFGNGQVSIKYCDFLDTPPNYIVINNSPHDAIATYNWWGTTITSDIDNSIYDFWDDMVDGKVIYTSYLSGPINLTTNITEELISNNNISIYPNPFSFESILRSSENLENATLTLYNLQGQKLKIINNISGNEIKLQRENLASGIYFIRLSQFDKVVITDKLIISD
jgi:hypothetical protein